MTSKLVIVESPTKAKTIKNYLPKGFHVMASMGHIRDLPQSAEEIPANVKDQDWAKIGVDVENDFAPLYVVPKNKKKTVSELKAAIKNADELYLATDEDREGESISWHLLEVLKPKMPIKRMVFHEITKEAIHEALENCRDVDHKLVRAQETRRILDRLVGYTLSPLLWKKIAYGLSAGRVQSVAVRLVVQRERERRAFHRGTYWDLKALLSHNKGEFEAQLMSVAGKKLATGKDFDETTGQIAKNRDVLLLNENQAEELVKKITGKTWTVSDIEEKPTTRRPYPPFITSTLQQEGNRKLGWTARDTMRVAQSLYENGFITYMRTDSVSLSGQAIGASRACVERMYGTEYLSPSPRQFSSKSKGAQEAHEAIRPAGGHFRTPQETGLSGRELALYDLIWKRTVATQMADAKQTQISASITVEEAVFRASGKRIDFPGFFRAYVEGSDDPEAALESREVVLPKMVVGDKPACQNLEKLGHETQPPARYTEASLVKMLESEGIGRPSTYATVLSTIVDRGYVGLMGQALVPTFTAFAVTGLLESHFPDLVDTGFTASMEKTLDDIATGDADWLPYLKKFYTSPAGLNTQVKIHEDQIDPEEARTVNLENLSAKVKIGRYGAYVEVTKEGEVTKATIPLDVPPADLDATQVETILKQKKDGPKSIGTDPKTGQPIFVLVGAYGPYVQLGEVTEENKKPKRSSLPKGVNTTSVTLELALGLLSLPRLLGLHAETGGRILASQGRFGPYIVHEKSKDEKDYRSLKVASGDDPVTISLERALELLAQPKASGRGRRGAATPLRDLGKHPSDGESVGVYNGPYGPYVKHGKVMASIPKEKKMEEVTLEESLVWLAEKAAAGSKPTRAKKRTKK